MTSCEPGIHNIKGIQDICFKQKHLEIEDLSFQAKVGYRETKFSSSNLEIGWVIAAFLWEYGLVLCIMIFDLLGLSMCAGHSYESWIGSWPCFVPIPKTKMISNRNTGNNCSLVSAIMEMILECIG